MQKLKIKATSGSTRLVLFGHSAPAYAKAVDNYLILALQKSNKIIALLVIFR